MKLETLIAPDKPYEIELAAGIAVTVRPLDTLGMAIAQAAAGRRIDELEKGAEVCLTAGLIPDGMPADLSDPAVRDGLRHRFLIDELGVRNIIAWRGVEGDNALTPGAIRAVLAIWPLAGAFFDKYTVAQMGLLLAKKECGAAAPGTSSQTAVPDTATDAGKTEPPAPEASPATAENSVPSSKTHRKRSRK